MTPIVSLGDRVLAARESGATMRCHTIPHHGEYSVAVHCYNLVSMLFIFVPHVSMNLVREALWHDAGERWVGDVPAPAKWGSRDLTIAVHQAEHTARAKWDLIGFGKLTVQEQVWLRLMDGLEFYLWCQDQWNMGNSHVENAMKAIYDHLEADCPDGPEFEDVRFFIEGHKWHRLEEGIS